MITEAEERVEEEECTLCSGIARARFELRTRGEDGDLIRPFCSACHRQIPVQFVRASMPAAVGA